MFGVLCMQICLLSQIIQRKHTTLFTNINIAILRHTFRHAQMVDSVDAMILDASRLRLMAARIVLNGALCAYQKTANTLTPQTPQASKG